MVEAHGGDGAAGRDGADPDPDPSAMGGQGDGGARASASGGASADAVGGEGDGPEEIGGAAGALTGHGGGEGGAAGAGGAGADPCAVDASVPLTAPLAETSLTLVAPFDVALGQGIQAEFADEPYDGAPKSLGCVEGKETNASLATGAGGVRMLSGATATLGTLVAAEHSSIEGWSSEDPVFDELMAEDASRSLLGYRHQWLALWSYFMTEEKRSTVQDCGNHFVRTISPARGVAIAFKVTFPSQETRGAFRSCFGATDVLAPADTTGLSRWLLQHEAELAIHVALAAGDPAATELVLASTACSVADLPACAQSLAALEQQAQEQLVSPEDTVPLAQLKPAWGAFTFSVAPLSLVTPD